MGYSHYWKIEEDMTVQEFKHLQSIAAKIAKASDAPVGLSINTHPLYPSITVEGMASDAHETFYLTPKAVKFDCCKTARKPYDEVVVGILDYANALGLLKFTSDGNPDDLAAGERLASVHYIAQDDEEYKANKAGDYVINWPEYARPNRRYMSTGVYMPSGIAGAEAARDVEDDEEYEVDASFDAPVAARDVDLDQVSLLLDKIQKITSRPLIITGDSRRDLDNLVALLRWEIDRR